MVDIKVQGLGLHEWQAGSAPGSYTKRENFVELMTLDHNLKASREGSK